MLAFEELDKGIYVKKLLSLRSNNHEQSIQKTLKLNLLLRRRNLSLQNYFSIYFLIEILKA